MTYWSSWGGDDIDLDKEVDADFDINFDMYFDIDLKKDVDIDVDVDSHAYVSGNTASALFDIEAVGTNTFTELDISALTIEGELSSLVGSITSAVGG